MKKIIFAVVLLLMAAPAFADVDLAVAVVPGTNDIEITFNDTASPNQVRALGLDISIVGDANIADVNCSVNADYYIYPGSIVIEGGVPTSWGQCDVGPLPAKNVTLEMGSLYAAEDAAHPSPPATSGKLAVLVMQNGSCGEVTVTVDANELRGGVVLEDPDVTPTTNLPVVAVLQLEPCPITECLKGTDPGYLTWVDFGSPDCWCYQKQCRGDTNGTMEMGRPVSGADLTLFKAAFNVAYATLLSTNPGGICADLNHTSEMGRPVSGADLTTFKQYFNVADASVPVCPMDNINFWTN
jgi:hypothetical protein